MQCLRRLFIMIQLNTVINELIKMENKYRVGRKLGMVILDVKTSREVARATTEEMADNICKLLNHQSKVNNGVLDDVSKQSELLIDFMRSLTDDDIELSIQEVVDNYLKVNSY